MSRPRRSITMSMSIRIPRRAEVVWPYLVDWERLDRWMLEARDFKVIGAQREGVGVEAETTVRIAGINTRDRVRVTRWEPPWLLELDHLGWVDGTGYMELTPQDGGTMLFWRENLFPPWGWLGAIGMRMMTPLMRRVFERDLRVLRDLIQEES
ncbi:MAG: SRPBCC family protein [Actinomycetota bacterium]